MARVVVYARGEAGTGGSMDSLACVRRVVGPLAHLAETRLFSGIAFSDLGEHGILTTGMMLAADIVVLHNLVPLPEEVAELEEAARRLRAGGHLPLWVYDLEDSALLREATVLHILPLMRLVTVPNSYLAHEGETLAGSMQEVEVLPSTYDLALFQRALLQRTSAEALEASQNWTIGCLGPHAWDRLLPRLFPVLAEHLHDHEWQRVRVLTDSRQVLEQCQSQGIRARLVEIRPAFYPAALLQCQVGLLPREGLTTEDTCWSWEYGAFGIPTLAACGSSYEAREHDQRGITFLSLHQPEEWAYLLLDWIRTDSGRVQHAEQGAAAYDAALAHRMAVVAPTYAAVYRQILPLSPRAR